MEMAREVKMPYNFVTGEPINLERLEAFAELVRADEREKVEDLLKEYDMVNSAFAKDFRARDKHD
jgi:hypothetical protein